MKFTQNGTHKGQKRSKSKAWKREMRRPRLMEVVLPSGDWMKNKMVGNGVLYYSDGQVI